MQESEWDASLLGGGPSNAERRKKLGRIIEEQMQKLGCTDREVAERVQVTAQAIRQYRLGQRLPRPSVLQRLAEALEIKEPSPETDSMSKPKAPPGRRAIRIGVSQHWNSAVFASLGPLFLERGIKPIFVPIGSRLEAVHSALEQSVDVVIHYQYLVQFDALFHAENAQTRRRDDGEDPQTRRTDNRYLGLQSDYPLFTFHGIHLFANKAHLLRVWEKEFSRKELEKLDEELTKYALLPYDHPRYEELVKAALEGSTIDVLEGTHYQYAAQKLYAQHQVTFNPHRPDGKSEEADRDPLSLFQEEAGGVNLYVGVNRDWLLLRKKLDAKNENRFIILVLPELIDVSPMACLIYRRGNSQLYEGAMQDLAHVWFTGIQQILAWTADMEDLDIAPNQTQIAFSHLKAVSSITNIFTGDFEVPLDADEIKAWFKRMGKHHTFYHSLADARAQQELSQAQEEEMAAIVRRYTPQPDWKGRAEEYRLKKSEP